jgi:hypothetical protein
MAQEATKLFLYGPNAAGEVKSFTCAAGTAIEKGTLLYLADNRTVLAHSTGEEPFAGVASMDKDSADTSTTISVWTNGEFIMSASTAITVGDQVILDIYANYVASSNNIALNANGKLVGIAQETGTTGPTGLVTVRILK